MTVQDIKSKDKIIATLSSNGITTLEHLSMIPVKRLGNPEEVAEGFLYLASDASAYMRGAELVMDGGVKTL